MSRLLCPALLLAALLTPAGRLSWALEGVCVRGAEFLTAADGTRCDLCDTDCFVRHTPAGAAGTAAVLNPGDELAVAAVGQVSSFVGRQLANMMFPDPGQEAQRLRILELERLQQVAAAARERQRFIAERDALLRELMGPQLMDELRLMPIGAAAPGGELDLMPIRAGTRAAKPPQEDFAASRRQKAIDCALSGFAREIERLGPEGRDFAEDLRADARAIHRDLVAHGPSGEPGTYKVFHVGADSAQSKARAGTRIGEAQVLVILGIQREETTGEVRLDIQYSLSKDGRERRAQNLIHLDKNGTVIRTEVPRDVARCLKR